MRTLYIDVYFFINLTVDMLSIHFASILSAIEISRKRVFFGAVIGALVAVLSVFNADSVIFRLTVMLLGLFLITLSTVRGVSYRRAIRFSLTFFIIEAVIGAVVGFLWDIFDKYLYDTLSSIEKGSVNRNLLFLAIFVLISIWVVKMIISFFSESVADSTVKIELCYRDKKIRLDAFVDSGNLAVDPMDMTPVLFLKSEEAKKLFPSEAFDSFDPNHLDKDFKRIVRFIPISRGSGTEVLIGVKIDGVYVVNENLREQLRVIVAIDKEGGSYGGYSALMPAIALKNVRKTN